MSDVAPKSSAVPVDDDEGSLEPTQAEIDAWVVEEKARRKAWLNGPTDEEKQAYAKRLKNRRFAEMFDEGEHRIDEASSPPRARSASRTRGRGTCSMSW